jgi:hypothetical protein
LTDITTKIIPFFSKYPIKGIKSLDFSDFCKVAQKMENKDHLTEEGLNQIRLIKSGMKSCGGKTFIIFFPYISPQEFV